MHLKVPLVRQHRPQVKNIIILCESGCESFKDAGIKIGFIRDVAIPGAAQLGADGPGAAIDESFSGSDFQIELSENLTSAIPINTKTFFGASSLSSCWLRRSADNFCGGLMRFFVRRNGKANLICQTRPIAMDSGTNPDCCRYCVAHIPLKSK